jgi:hypothetical protein
MPMYFVIPVAIAYGLTTRDRLAVRRASALLGGFLLVTGVYSLWISQQLGQFVYIENHGGISIHRYGGVRTPGVPGFADIAGRLFGVFWQSPRGFLIVWWGYAAALFHVHGDRWLHSYLAASAEGAVVAKAIAHAGIDLPFIASVVLAPLGVVLARRRREAAMLGFWIALMVVLTALSAYGGVRYRAPLEPHLIALASVVLAGSWRRPGRLALIAASLMAVLAANFLLGQLPRVARARANYGLRNWSATAVGRPWALGRLGLNVLPTGSHLEVRLYPSEPVAPQPIHVSVRIDGHHVTDRVLQTEPVLVRFIAKHRGFHYVELNATDAAGRQARVAIDVPR